MKSSLFASLVTGLLAALLIAGIASGTSDRSWADRLADAVSIQALRHGDRGESVATLQRALLEAGFDPGPIDGIFGPLTEGAVRKAQGRLGLVVDGLAGRLTATALRDQNPQAQVAQEAPAEPLAAGDGLMVYQAASEAPAPVQSVTAGRGANPLGLTFNGLPAQEQLERLLAMLQRIDMKATFFVTGEEAERAPALVQRIAETGHEVGNNGYTAVDLRRLTPLSLQAQIRRAQRSIAQAAGKPPVYFRPPQGLYDRRVEQAVEAEGLRLVLWSNVGVRPGPEVDPQRLVERLEAGLYPGAVVMLPLGQAEGVKGAEALLARLSGTGYRSEPLSALLRGPS